MCDCARTLRSFEQLPSRRRFRDSQQTEVPPAPFPGQARAGGERRGWASGGRGARRSERASPRRRPRSRIREAPSGRGRGDPSARGEGPPPPGSRHYVAPERCRDGGAAARSRGGRGPGKEDPRTPAARGNQQGPGGPRRLGMRTPEAARTVRSSFSRFEKES